MIASLSNQSSFGSQWQLLIAATLLFFTNWGLSGQSLCTPNSGDDIISSCAPYIWIDGNTYTTSTNAPTFTLTNKDGCDSVVTLDLTILESAPLFEIHINAGGGAYTAANGDEFIADQYFNGGSTFSTTNPIANTTDDALFQSERYKTDLAYDIPVSFADTFIVSLYFAEIFDDNFAIGERVFDVSLEGQLVLDDYDIYADAGAGDAAVIKTFRVFVGDGVLNLTSSGTANNPKLSAISVVSKADTGACSPCLTLTATSCLNCPAAPTYNTTLPDPISIGSGLSNQNMSVMEQCGLNVGIKAHKRFLGNIIPTGNTYTVEIGESPVSGSDPTPDPGTARWNYLVSVNLGTYTFNDLLVYQKIDFDPADGPGQTGPYVADLSQFMIDNGLGGTSFLQASENLGFGFWQTIGDAAILPFDPFATGVYDQVVEVWTKDSVLLLSADMRVEVFKEGCTDPTRINYDPTATVDDGSCDNCFTLNSGVCTSCVSAPTTNTTLPDPILVGTGLSNQHMVVMQDCGLNVGIKAHKRFLGDVTPKGNTYTFEIGESPVSGSDPTPDPGTARWNYLVSVNLGTYTFNDLQVYQKIDFDPADGSGQTGPYIADISQFMIANSLGGTSLYQESQNLGFNFWQTIGDAAILPFDPFATGVYNNTIEVWTKDSVLLLTADMRVEVVKLGCTDPLASNFDPTATQDDGSCNACITVNTFDDPINSGTTQAPDTWYTDRYEPASFGVASFMGDNRLKHSIAAADGTNNRPGSFSSTFYDTQGKKYDFTPGSTGILQIDLYVPASWAGTGRRMAGLWGTAFDAADAISAYPIIEFTSTDGAPRFRGWNGAGWDDLGLPEGFVYDEWYTLRIELLPGGEFRYSVNDLVYTTSTFGSNASTYIGDIILQGHNNSTGVSYDIYWDNLHIGQPASLLYGATLPDPIVIGSGISNQNMAVSEFCNINSGIKAFKRFLGDVVPVDGDRPGDTYQFGTGVSPTDATNTTPDPGTARWNFLFSVNLGNLTFNDVKVFLDIDFDPSDGSGQTGPYVADISQTLIDSGFGGQSFFQSSQNLGFGFWQLIGDPNILPFDPYAEGVYDLALRIETLTGVSLQYIPIRVEVGCEFINPSENLEVAAMICPADITVYSSNSTDPWHTGMASLSDGCDVNISYADDRSGLDQCNNTGVILRTFRYDDGVNKDSCVQSITVVDTTAPSITACPADTTLMDCSTQLAFDLPEALDVAYHEGFEDPAFMADNSGSARYQGWNAYTSQLMRVNSGDNGISSASGSAHAVIDTSTSSSFTGAFSRLGGYRYSFGEGFMVSADIYIDLSAPGVANDTYGWDLSVAASRQDSSHLRDFIFHAASDASGNVLIGGSNNTNFTRRNDLASINSYSIGTSGWYTFEWNFRDSSGSLAVDLILRDAAGNFLWKETRYNAADLIASLVGGNRYMWFTFLEVGQLAFDNVKVTRNVDVVSTSASGNTFPVGVTNVSCSATDDCGNAAACDFDVTVLDKVRPVAVCKDTVVYLDANGTATLSAEDLDGGSTDDCSTTLVFSASQTSFSCDDLPQVEVEVYVTDQGGNIDTCVAMVSVLDTLDAEYDGDTLNTDDCTDCFVKVPFDNPVSLAPSEAIGVWYTDRYAPNFFGTASFDGDQRLKHSIAAADGSNNRPGSFGSSFYNTQGRQYILPYAEAGILSIDLYVPASWATTDRRMAGLWGIGFNAGGSISAYPIIEFTSTDGQPRFRGYEGDGTWIDIGLPGDFSYDSWQNLRIELLPNGEFRYSVGDQVVTTKAHGSYGTMKIGRTILQGHNNDVGVTYDIYWDNLMFGEGIDLNYAHTLPDPIAIGSGISNQNMAVAEYCGMNGGIKAFKRFLGDVVPVDGDRPGDTYQFGTGVSPTSSANTTPDPGTARWNFLFSVNLGNLTFNDVKVYLDIDFDPSDQSGQTAPYVADIGQTLIDSGFGGLSFFQASQNLGFSFWQLIGDPSILPFDPYAEGVYDLALRVEALDGTRLMYIPIRVEAGCEFIDPAENLEPASIVCPADITVYKPNSIDPWHTGMAVLSDGCTNDITYSDDNSGLNLCNMTGVILRKFVYDNGVQKDSCVQTITVVDTSAPELSSCAGDITVDAITPSCVAAVSFDRPTALEVNYLEDFENTAFMADNSGALKYQGWNAYTSHVLRANSGDAGITSAGGSGHAVIDTSTSSTFTGAFSRLGGYSNNFGDGFVVSTDIYIDLSSPGVANNTYGWDLSVAANRQTGGHLRDFIFHAASDANGNVLIGGSNNSNFSRRNDLASINSYSIGTSGWYTFEWNFRDSSGALAVDLILRDAAGNFLWKETRYNAADLIASIVGGNRYMWFTFVDAAQLAIDNVKMIRPLPVSCTKNPGDIFAVGTTLVTCSAIDSCGNTAQCSFNVTVNDITRPVAVCQDITVFLDNNGTATINPADLDGGSSDDCTSNLLFEASQTSFDCSDFGVVPVKFYVSDISGNMDSCVSNVTVTTPSGNLPGDTTELFLTTCDPAQVGVSTVVLSNQLGCDSTVITTTSLLPVDTTNIAATTCDPAQVGVVTQVFTNTSGCDSTVITTTTLLPSDTTQIAATTCDPAQVGVVSQVFTNTSGCDSTVITTTTLLPVDTTNISAITCNPAEAGIVTQVFTNVFGCDSTVIITTTLLPTDSISESATACDSYTWPVNGQTYTSSGSYFANLVNQFGCDSVVELSLTINQSDTIVENVAVCNSYTWPANGQTYTTSGVYYTNLLNSSGCDSVLQLDLTIGIGNTIVQMNLVTAPAGTLIDPLTNGYVINKALIGGSFSIEAIPCTGTVGSVVFNVNGNNVQTESVAPYVIEGDKPPGVIDPWNPAVGFYTITATPYSSSGGNGTMGTPLTYTIQVIDQVVVADCNGDLGGGAFINDCGECVAGNTGKPVDFGKDDCGICFGNNADKDCNGDCFGTAVIDSCGECVLGNTGKLFNNSCNIDCNGDINGTATLDDCGVCTGGNTGIVPNSNKDCAGVCFGTAVIDDCGECVLGTTGKAFNESCEDCNGDPFGTAFIDDCGVCVGGNTGKIANADKDTCGVCFGNNLSCAPCQPLQVTDLVLVDAGTGTDIVSLTNNYVIVKSAVGPFSIRADVCNEDSVESVRFFLDGNFIQNENISPYSINGDNSSGYRPWNIAAGTYDLTAVPYSANNGNGTAGIDLTLTLIIQDSGPVTDCNGDIGGSAFINDCGECVAGNTGKPVDFGKDDCGVCFGNNADKDCAGVCFGTAVVDSCGDCVLGTTGLPFNGGCTVDCNGDVNGTAFLDDCGVCVGGNTGKIPNADKDTCGVCFGNNLSCAPCQPLEVVSLTLMNTGFAGPIRVLNDVDTIIKSQLGSFSVRADVCTEDSVESVRFFIDGSLFQNENISPYAIDGDAQGSFNPWNVAPGNYQVTATPYSSNNGNGTVGISKTIDLWVFDTAPLARALGDQSNTTDAGRNEQGDPEGDKVTSGQIAGSGTSPGPEDQMQLRVYPNPTTGVITVELVNVEESAEILLLDASGKILVSQKVAPDNAYLKEQLDLSAFPDGIYMLKISSGDELKTRRVIRN